jgi:hypothetical protein
LRALGLSIKPNCSISSSVTCFLEKPSHSLCRLRWLNLFMELSSTQFLEHNTGKLHPIVVPPWRGFCFDSWDAEPLLRSSSFTTRPPPSAPSSVPSPPTQSWLERCPRTQPSSALVDARPTPCFQTDLIDPSAPLHRPVRTGMTPAHKIFRALSIITQFFLAFIERSRANTAQVRRFFKPG